MLLKSTRVRGKEIILALLTCLPRLVCAAAACGPCAAVDACVPQVGRLLSLSTSKHVLLLRRSLLSTANKLHSSLFFVTQLRLSS